MSKDKKLGVVIWLLSFALAMVFMFCLERGETATFWITFGFVCFAFVSTLLFHLVLWKNSTTTDKLFLRLSPIVVSSVYMIAQIPIGIVFSLGSSSIPYKATLLVNAVVCIISWIIILSGLVGNDHIEKVNSRQKDHHTEL